MKLFGFFFGKMCHLYHFWQHIILNTLYGIHKKLPHSLDRAQNPGTAKRAGHETYRFCRGDRNEQRPAVQNRERANGADLAQAFGHYELPRYQPRRFL